MATQYGFWFPHISLLNSSHAWAVRLDSAKRRIYVVFSLLHFYVADPMVELRGNFEQSLKMSSYSMLN